MTAYRVKREAFQRKCPNCGAALVYAPKEKKLYCAHCRSFVDFDKSGQVKERDFTDLINMEVWNDNAVSYYRCDNCGANTVLPRSTLATTCPYCSSPVVLDETQTGHVRPDTVVPFELSVDEAEKCMAQWARKKLFAPRAFRKKAKASSVKGVYTPAWTFDLQTSTEYSGRLGRTRTRTVRRNGKSYTETYVDWFYVEGVFDDSFDDIYVSGSSHISVKDFRELDLTNQAKYVAYTDEYLAGYIADNYTVSPEDAYKSALKQADAEIYRAIMARYGADHDGGLRVETNILSRSFKYVMLPVYVVSGKYRKKVYNQYVSGVHSKRDNNRAKVVGKAPVSPWKILLTVLLGLGLIAGIIALVWFNRANFSFDLGDLDDYYAYALPKFGHNACQILRSGIK